MGIKIKYTIEEYYQDTNHTNKKRFHNLKYIEKVADLSVDALAKLIRSHGSAIEKSATELSISDLFAFVKAFDEEFHAGKQEGVDKREARKYNDYTYTKEQYDSFGWVRANDVLNADQYRDFTRRFADVVARGYAVEKSLYGEYIIPVSGMSDEHYGIDNIIVFAKGTIERPIITRVVKIDLESETEIEQVREFIVEYEKQNGESIDVAQNYYGQEIVIQIRKRDELSYQEYSASKRRNGGRNSSQSDNGVDRSRTGGGRNHSESEKADVKQNIDEDSETIRRSKKPMDDGKLQFICLRFCGFCIRKIALKQKEILPKPKDSGREMDGL